MLLPILGCASLRIFMLCRVPPFRSVFKLSQLCPEKDPLFYF